VTDGQGVAVSVDYGIPDGDYTVRADPAIGPASDLGTMTVTRGKGSFTGKSREPLSRGSSISLVDASGHPTCQGTVA
jgi:hypothetical protein